MIVCSESPLDAVKYDVVALQRHVLEYVQHVAHCHNLLAGRLDCLRWTVANLRAEFEGHLNEPVMASRASGKLMVELEEIQKGLASVQRMLQHLWSLRVPRTPSPRRP